MIKKIIIVILILTVFAIVITSSPFRAWALQNWIQDNTDGFGDAKNTASYAMSTYNNKLYVGTRNTTTGAEVWQYDGVSWTQSNTEGFVPRHKVYCYRLIYYRPGHSRHRQNHRYCSGSMHCHRTARPPHR